MTPDRITQLAQANPVRTLTTRLGELKEQADREVANLETTLRHIDATCELLKQHGLPQSVTLGPVGDAAAVTRRDLGKQQGQKFELPKGEAA